MTQTSWLTWTPTQGQFLLVFQKKCFIFFLPLSQKLSSSVVGIVQRACINIWAVTGLFFHSDVWPSCSCSTLKSVEFIWMRNWWEAAFEEPVSCCGKGPRKRQSQLSMCAEEGGCGSAREAAGPEQRVPAALTHAQQSGQLTHPSASASDLCTGREVHPSGRTSCRFPRWPGESSALHRPVQPFIQQGAPLSR